MTTKTGSPERFDQKMSPVPNAVEKLARGETFTLYGRTYSSFSKGLAALRQHTQLIVLDPELKAKFNDLDSNGQDKLKAVKVTVKVAKETIFPAVVKAAKSDLMFTVSLKWDIWS